MNLQWRTHICHTTHSCWRRSHEQIMNMKFIGGHCFGFFKGWTEFPHYLCRAASVFALISQHRYRRHHAVGNITECSLRHCQHLGAFLVPFPISRRVHCAGGENLRISPPFLKKFKITIIFFSGAWGKVIHKKNLKQKNLVTLSIWTSMRHRFVPL